MHLEYADLADLLLSRAASSPKRTAFTYLSEGADPTSITYAELDSWARAIGAWLQSAGLSGVPVMLICPAGLEMIATFFGCLYAGAIAVPVPVPRKERIAMRLVKVAQDAGIAAILHSAAIPPRPLVALATAIGLDQNRCIALHSIPGACAPSWKRTVPSLASVAYLQYSSGSTGDPKGVMVTHQSALHNSACIRRTLNYDEQVVSLTWLPHFHDMGLVEGILQPVFSGFRAYVMSPVSFIQRPVSWVENISKYRVTHSGGPNFAYALCAEKATQEQIAELDLSNWRAAYCGAEPVRRRTIENFCEIFAPCGFRSEAFHPCYGLAEATLVVSCRSTSAPQRYLTVNTRELEQNRIVADPSGRVLVSCGREMPETSIAIVDPSTRARCAPDGVGEIWVESESVTGGYWRKDEETEQIFRAFLADSSAGPFLRTGDLGFIHEGELFITGRLKQLVILNGRNLYPHDIEFTIEQNVPGIQPGCCAAFSVDLLDSEALVIAAEIDWRRMRQVNHRGLDPEHLRNEAREIRKSVIRVVAADHEIEVNEVVLLRPGALYKTPSGKLQRNACRAAYLQGEFETLRADLEGKSVAAAAAGNPQALAGKPGLHSQNGKPQRGPAAIDGQLEQWLVRRIAELVKINASEINTFEPFANYGLSSVNAAGLAGELERLLKRPCPPTLLYDYPSIHQLVQGLTAGSKTLKAERNEI